LDLGHSSRWFRDYSSPPCGNRFFNVPRGLKEGKQIAAIKSTKQGHQQL